MKIQKGKMDLVSVLRFIYLFMAGSLVAVLIWVAIMALTGNLNG
jgi:hypothetical protein